MYLSQISITFSSLIHSLMDTRLFLNLGYHQQCCREQGGAGIFSNQRFCFLQINTQMCSCCIPGEFLCFEGLHPVFQRGCIKLRSRQ